MATTYTVKKGDTVWALSRRALEQQLGRKPTNAEIAAVVNKVNVPSGNRNLIYPGERITIPVKTTTRGQDADAARYQGKADTGKGSARPAAPSKPKKRRSSDAATGLVAGAAIGGAVGAAAGSRKRKTKNAAAAASGKKFADAAAKDRAGEKIAADKLKAGTPPRKNPKGSTSGKGKGASKAAKGPTQAQITSYNNARNAINGATTAEAVELAGKRITKTNLTDSQKKALRNVYKKKMKAVSAGAAGAAKGSAPKSGPKKGPKPTKSGDSASSSNRPKGRKSVGTKAKPGSAGRPKSDAARYVGNYNKRIRDAKTPAELNKVRQAVKRSGAIANTDARSKLMDKIDKKSKTLKAADSIKKATGQKTVKVVKNAAKAAGKAASRTGAGKAAVGVAALAGAVGSSRRNTRNRA